MFLSSSVREPGSVTGKEQSVKYRQCIGTNCSTVLPYIVHVYSLVDCIYPATPVIYSPIVHNITVTVVLLFFLVTRIDHRS
jgi:hypothetical protein